MSLLVQRAAKKLLLGKWYSHGHTGHTSSAGPAYNYETVSRMLLQRLLLITNISPKAQFKCTCNVFILTASAGSVGEYIVVIIEKISVRVIFMVTCF